MATPRSWALRPWPRPPAAASAWQPPRPWSLTPSSEAWTSSSCPPVPRRSHASTSGSGSAASRPRASRNEPDCASKTPEWCSSHLEDRGSVVEKRFRVLCPVDKGDPGHAAVVGSGESRLELPTDEGHLHPIGRDEGGLHAKGAVRIPTVHRWGLSAVGRPIDGADDGFQRCGDDIRVDADTPEHPVSDAAFQVGGGAGVAAGGQRVLVVVVHPHVD